MRLLIILSVCVCVFCHDYSDMSTQFGFDDPAVLKSHIDCYLDRSPCDDTAAHYKRHISEGFSDACQDCNPKLAHNINVFFKKMKALFPEDYKDFQMKYDPVGKKMAAIEKAVAQY